MVWRCYRRASSRRRRPDPTVKSKSPAPLEDAFDNLAVTDATASSSSPAPAAEELEAPAEDPFEGVEIKHRTKAELYLFDTETDMFVAQGEEEVTMDIAVNAEFDCTLLPY